MAKIVSSEAGNPRGTIVAKPGHWEEAEAEEGVFKPLTRDEAQALRQASPPLSLWMVVAGQVLIGLLVVVVAWFLTGRASVAWSAAYGSLSVVVPAALFARGLSRQKSASLGGAALAGFAVWELVKIALTVAMLFAAPRLVTDLNWLALVAGFVVTMKAYWVAMWFRLTSKSSVPKNLKN